MGETNTSEATQLALLKAAAYELKKPISHIHGLTSLLASGKIKDDLELLQQYKYLQDSSKRMQVLIDSLIFLGQIETNQLKLDFDTINPASVVKDVLYDLKPTASHYDRTLDLNVSASLSPVNANAEAMRYAFYNLVDATIRTSQSEVIELALKRSHAHCIISLRDIGEDLNQGQLKSIEQNIMSQLQPMTGYGASSALSVYIAKSLSRTFQSQISCSTVNGRRTIKLSVPNSHQLTLV